MDLSSLLDRLRAVETSHLADADKQLRIMDPGLRPMGVARRFAGPAFTLICREDFMTVLVALDEAPAGAVLVIDTLGSRRAVLGELFSLEAARRGFAAILVDGLVRDTVTLQTLALPVYARGASPLAGTAKLLGPVQVPVGCGGVTVNPGDLVVGDEDGVVVASPDEVERVLPLAEQIEARERAVIARLAAGESLLSLVNYREHRANLEAGRDSALRFSS